MKNKEQNSNFEFDKLKSSGESVLAIALVFFGFKKEFFRTSQTLVGTLRFFFNI